MKFRGQSFFITFWWDSLTHQTAVSYLFIYLYIIIITALHFFCLNWHTSVGSKHQLAAVSAFFKRKEDESGREAATPVGHEDNGTNKTAENFLKEETQSLISFDLSSYTPISPQFLTCLFFLMATYIFCLSSFMFTCCILQNPAVLGSGNAMTYWENLQFFYWHWL